MLTKNDSVVVRGASVPITISVLTRPNNHSIDVIFSCTVDGLNFSKIYKTRDDDKTFYQDFKKYIDDSLTVISKVRTRLENKGFSEVEA